MINNKFFQPQLIRKIVPLAYRCQLITEHFLTGSHRSRRSGTTGDFRQHRPYVHGDDPRQIDWKVWGRQDRFYIKQRHFDAHRELLVILDDSPSMNYRGESWSKYDCGATLTVCLTWLAIKQNDGAGCLLWNRGTVQSLPIGRHPTIPLLIANMLEQKEATTEKTKRTPTKSWFALFRYWAEHLPRGAIVAVVSDLFVDRNDFFRGIGLLTAKGIEPVVFHLLDDHEIDLNIKHDETIIFRDLESTATIEVDPQTIRKQYREIATQFIGEVRNELNKKNVRSILVRTSDPIEQSLIEFTG